MAKPKREPSKSVLAFIIFGLFSFFFLTKAAWLGDEGMVLSAAQRIAGGEVMYRDFFEFWTPLAPYLAAGGVGLLGKLRSLGLDLPFLVWPRAVFATNIFLIALLSYSFSQRLIQNRWLRFVPPLIFLTSVASSEIGFNHNWVALNLATWTVWLSFKQFRFKWTTLGFLTGLTILTIQTQGFALLLWCLWGLRCETVVNSGPALLKPGAREFLSTRFLSPGPRFTSSPALPYLLGLGLPIAITLIYFTSQRALPEFLYATVVFPFTGYQHNNVANALDSVVLSLIVFYLGFIGLLRQRREKIPVFLVLSLIFTIPAFFTPGPAHSALTFPFVLPLVVATAEKVIPQLFRYQKKFRPKHQAFLMLTAYGIFFLTLDLPFRILPDLSRAITKLNTPLRTKAGILHTYDWQAQMMDEINRFMQDYTRPGEYVLAAPYSAIFYLFNEIKNPIRYSQLTPRYNPDWMFAETIADLERAQPRYIIFFPSDNPFPFDKHNPLSQYVLEKYKIIKKYQPRRESNNSPTDGIYERRG